MVLAVLLQGPEVTEYAEPYDTLWTVTLVALALIYLAGLPATVSVSAALWRSRTRRDRPLPAYVAAAAVPPAPPPALRSDSDAEALGHLQRVEQQVLALRGGPAPAGVHARLAAEVAQLLTRYGIESTVGGRAAVLQLIVAALAPPEATAVLSSEPPDPSAVGAGGGVPDRLRVELGRLAAVGQPIPARWAFSWYGHVADRLPYQAAQRPAEFAQAFARRYRERFPHGGMIVALTGRRLTLRYPPVGVHFGGRPIEVPTDLPDVVEVPEAVRRLRTVGEAAQRDLGPPLSP